MLPALLPLLILILVRWVFLDARVIHHDEAVNGWFIDGLLQRGYYVYDPQNYHGPLFFYWTALSEMIFGRSVVALRIPAVLFGSLLTLAPFLFRRWIGVPAAFLASCMLAVSPAMVFFSRYAIHETAFAFFEALFLAVWLHCRTDGWSRNRAVALGLVLGLMAGIKENFVILGAAVLFSEWALAVFHRREGRVPGLFPVIRDAGFWRFWGVAAATAALVIVVTFTGGFQDGEGVRKFFEAFLKWMHTGTRGNGHEKPFYYWLQLMGRYEWAAFLGLLMVPFFFKRANDPLRLIGLTGSALLLVYSLVSYKTPWCLLSFHWTFVIFGSALFVQVAEDRIHRAGVRLFLLAGIVGSIHQAVDVAFLNPEQDGHPYIYGQTYPDLIAPVERILERFREHPAGTEDLRVQVLSGSTWPLPFLLGGMRKAGYYSEANAPPVLDADFVIMDENLLERFSRRLKGAYSHECVRSRQWAQKMCFFTRLPDTKGPSDR
jgi:uncharacterized protein (TIGR03663 family)